MIESGLHAVMIKVAALGLDPRKHLGKSIAQLEPHLLRLAADYGSHVCGEGGEYETLVLDSPLFTHAKVVLDASEVRRPAPPPTPSLRPFQSILCSGQGAHRTLPSFSVVERMRNANQAKAWPFHAVPCVRDYLQVVYESNDSVAPVAYLRPTAFHTELKPPSSHAALHSTISAPMSGPLASPSHAFHSLGNAAAAGHHHASHTAALLFAHGGLRGTSVVPSPSALPFGALAVGSQTSSAGGAAPSPTGHTFASTTPTDTAPATALPAAAAAATHLFAPASPSPPSTATAPTPLLPTLSAGTSPAAGSAPATSPTGGPPPPPPPPTLASAVAAAASAPAAPGSSSFLLGGAGGSSSSAHHPSPPHHLGAFLLASGSAHHAPPAAASAAAGGGSSSTVPSFLRMSSNVRASRTGQFATHLLPAVHVVPDDYVPQASTATARDAGRQSMERRPGLCNVHLRSRRHADYVQVCARALRAFSYARLPPAQPQSLQSLCCVRCARFACGSAAEWWWWVARARALARR